MQLPFLGPHFVKGHLGLLYLYKTLADCPNTYDKQASPGVDLADAGADLYGSLGHKYRMSAKGLHGFRCGIDSALSPIFYHVLKLFELFHSNTKE